MLQSVERQQGIVVHGYLLPPNSPRSEAWDAVLVRPSAPGYRAEARSWQIGGIAACDFRDSAAAVVTPWKPAMGPGSYYLGLLLAGQGTLTQRALDGTQTTIDLEPGRLALYSRAHPFRLTLEASYHYLVLELQPTVVGLDERSLQAASAREELTLAPSSQLLAGMLKALPDQLPLMSPQLRLQTADAVTLLLAGGLSAVQVGHPAGDRLFDEIMAWLETHLADPELAPGTIAAAHHISVRYLHKIFSRHGLTVAGYVRSRRLELFRRDLADPAKADTPVSVLARRRGWENANHLCKAFRARYGTSPREYRGGAAG